MRVPWTARRSNQSILKEMNLEEMNNNILKEILKEMNIEKTVSKAEALVLWPLEVKSQLIGKVPDAGKD